MVEKRRIERRGEHRRRKVSVDVNRRCKKDRSLGVDVNTRLGEDRRINVLVLMWTENP